MMQVTATWLSTLGLVVAGLFASSSAIAADADSRHQRVAARREGITIICHRGAVEFAHENTLEAYRAAFLLGADGNEIDIRATKDGILVCFHDDMLDHLLDAYGDVSDYSWDELRRFPFRNPGVFAEHCRIPTLDEVLALHREYAGLLHLDIKRPEIIPAVMRQIDKLDMWDHVVQAPSAFNDPRVKRSRLKGSLYLDRGEVDAKRISETLRAPGDSIMVEDPRGVAVALGRTIRRPPTSPVAPMRVQPANPPRTRDLEMAVEVLRDADDWNRVATGESDEESSGRRIVRRAMAADTLRRHGVLTPTTSRLLIERVRRRSLHRHWRYHGLDGAAALRALMQGNDQRAADLARFCLWRDDPTIAPVVNPMWNNPRAWTDWRTKNIVFSELANIPGESTQQVCKDYLALSDAEAEQIGILQFEAAARTLITVSPSEATARQLMQHRRGDVRGRAILACLAVVDEPWAMRALHRAAPHALAYRVPETDRSP